MTRRWTLCVALAAVLLVALCTNAAAAAAEDGKRLYRVHCLACHGESGQGDGPMKDQLDTTIPDLTTLAARNDGEFPTDKVHQTIDGRYESAAHGTREMPVWGFTFQSTGRETAQETDVHEMVAALTTYLETLQPKRTTQASSDEPGD